MNNKKSTLDEEIKNIKENLLKAENILQQKKEKLQNLETVMSKKSGRVLEINKLIVEGKSKLENLKKDADKLQIDFLLKKQKNDELVL